jgi:hypothetical protein
MLIKLVPNKTAPEFGGLQSGIFEIEQGQCLLL